MSSHKFRKITVIEYNQKRFQVFRDEKGKYAFLEIDINDKYHYPQIEDFIGLANIFSRDIHSEAMFEQSKQSKRKKKLYTFTASVLAATSIISCSYALYNELKANNQLINSNVEEVVSVADEIIDQKDNTETIVHEEPEESSNFIKTETPPTEETFEEVKDEWYDIAPNEIDVTIYNSKALNKFLGPKHVTIDDVKEAINSNTNIDKDLKEVFIDFAEQIMETYPTVDMRLFYENAKRVKVIYEPQEVIDEHGGQLAWYNWREMAIHVNEYSKFKPGSYDLMIIRHELCHMISNSILMGDNFENITVTIKDENYGTYIQEASAVALSAYPFEEEYYFSDLGYGIIANEFRAIIESDPNFDIGVIANQNVYGIADYFDKMFKSDIDARTLFDLMEAQTIGYYNLGYIQVDENDIAKIYKYVADVYKKNVLNPNMTYMEIMDIQNDLIYKLNDNITPDSGYTRTDVIEDEFRQYMIDNNIMSNSKTK